MPLKSNLEKCITMLSYITSLKRLSCIYFWIFRFNNIYLSDQLQLPQDFQAFLKIVELDINVTELHITKPSHKSPDI